MSLEAPLEILPPQYIPLKSTRAGEDQFFIIAADAFKNFEQMETGKTTANEMDFASDDEEVKVAKEVLEADLKMQVELFNKAPNFSNFKWRDLAAYAKRTSQDPFEMML